MSEGNFIEALTINPVGYIVAMIMLLAPLWIALDIITKRATLFAFYQAIENCLKRPIYAIPLITLILINYMSVFKVQKVKDKTEEKLGELFWDMFHKSETVNTNPFVVNSIDSLVNGICSANKIDSDLIKVHIVNKDVINAFALPNGHLIIYSGLISLNSSYAKSDITGSLGMCKNLQKSSWDYSENAGNASKFNFFLRRIMW